MKGIYPDLLHILDLALLVDMYASSYTNGARTTDTFFVLATCSLLWWWFELSHNICVTAGPSYNSGIPHGCRARAQLFSMQTLGTKNSSYPAIGQKRLSGAASRMMVYFAIIMASEIAEQHPSDIHRSVLKKHVLTKHILKFPNENMGPSGGSMMSFQLWPESQLYMREMDLARCLMGSCSKQSFRNK